MVLTVMYVTLNVSVEGELESIYQLPKPASHSFLPILRADLTSVESYPTYRDSYTDISPRSLSAYLRDP